MGTVRLDVGKIASITACGGGAPRRALCSGCGAAGTPMWFNNTEPLEQVLRAAFNEQASDAIRSFWLLLFELYVLQGKNEAFEELGLEYAVAFEMSPPNWEVYVNSVAQAARRGRARAAAPRGGARPRRRRLRAEGRDLDGQPEPVRGTQRPRGGRHRRSWST